MTSETSYQFKGIQYFNYCQMCKCLFDIDSLKNHMQEHIIQLCDSFKTCLCKHETYGIANNLYIGYEPMILSKFIKSYMVIDPQLILDIKQDKNIFWAEKNNFNQNGLKIDKQVNKLNQCFYQSEEECAQKMVENFEEFNNQISQFVSYLIQSLIQINSCDFLKPIKSIQEINELQKRQIYQQEIDALIPFPQKYKNVKHIKDLTQIQSVDFKNQIQSLNQPYKEDYYNRRLKLALLISKYAELEDQIFIKKVLEKIPKETLLAQIQELEQVHYSFN